MIKTLELIIKRLEKQVFDKYMSGLIDAIPTYIYHLLALVLLTGMVALVVWKGKRCVILLARLLCLEYVFLIICSTIVFRQFSESKTIEYRLFWSYEQASIGNIYLFFENMMNIIIFIPLGFLLCIAFPKVTLWQVIIAGFAFSLAIELMQLKLQRGLCEVDDLIHNTIGCIIGVLFFQLAKATYKILQKDKLIS